MTGAETAAAVDGSRTRRAEVRARLDRELRRMALLHRREIARGRRGRPGRVPVLPRSAGRGPG